MPGTGIVEDTSSIKNHHPLVLPEVAINPGPFIIVASITAVDKLDHAMRERPLPAVHRVVPVFNRRTIIIFPGALAADGLLLEVLGPSNNLSPLADSLSVGNHGDYCVAIWYAF